MFRWGVWHGCALAEHAVIESIPALRWQSGQRTLCQNTPMPTTGLIESELAFIAVSQADGRSGQPTVNLVVAMRLLSADESLKQQCVERAAVAVCCGDVI
ncbi:MAG: hypothetical protein CTY19_11120 [Methylomonas sp.]|nr:MAG: hypothetical protein CTY19_11120 [Methylomonas sp.]